MAGRVRSVGIVVAAVAALALLGAMAASADLQAAQAAAGGLFERAPVLGIGLFIALLALTTSLCIPGAMLSLSLAAGAIFGLEVGVAVIAAGSLIGASITFIAARHLAQDWVRRRFGPHIGQVDAGFGRHGLVYLLGSRLAGLPHFAVTLGFAVTGIRYSTFALATLIGSLPLIGAYVAAGAGLERMPADWTWGAALAAAAAAVAVPVVLRRLRRAPSPSPA